MVRRVGIKRLHEELRCVGPARGTERVGEHARLQVRCNRRYVRVVDEPKGEGIEGGVRGCVGRISTQSIADGAAVEEERVKARLERCGRRREVCGDVLAAESRGERRSRNPRSIHPGLHECNTWYRVN